MGWIFWCRQLRFDIIIEKQISYDRNTGQVDSISKFHSNHPKTHSFYGNYLCCWIFCLSNWLNALF